MDKKQHLIIKSSAISIPYTSPKGGRGSTFNLFFRDRQAHATHLISQLENLKKDESEIIQQQEELEIETSGIQITFQSEPNFNLKLKSLEYQRSGIELCSSHLNSDDSTTATVFIPEGKINHFLKKVIQYQDENTKPDQNGIIKPKNQPLVDSISDIKLATLEALWTDDINLLPQSNTDNIWWEVWIRLSDEQDNVGLFREHAERLGFQLNNKTLTFVDRAVILAYGNKQNMAQSILLLGVIAELRLAKETAEFFINSSRKEQSEWIDDTKIQVSENINSYVCLLDTGVNYNHPLLAKIIDADDTHTYNPAWGVDDRHGHGTGMAGLITYGDLTDVLASQSEVTINHKIESVKILPNPTEPPNAPKLYGAITQESISRVEIENPRRSRIFCMAVTTNDFRDRGKPSSWSAKIDAITFEDKWQKLIIISGGNIDSKKISDYLKSNDRDNIQDPGQSWNALTVGGFTEKIHITDPDYSAYTPVAPSGGLSPTSSTSTTWDHKNWPIKPDIVMEAGNMGIDKEDDNFVSTIDSLELLSTHHDINERLLMNFRETSASAALAARLAAILQAQYPDFWPETLRALLVHSAEWTDALKLDFDLSKKEGYKNLLRFCGYGVPNYEKLLWSTTNSLTLIAQDNLQPFFKDKNNSIKTKDINLHEIPWPTDILTDLGEIEVKMKVTLSYFIEPNPGQRGWSTKYRYASHRLQFDVKRSLENIEGFKQRINKQARNDDFNASNNQTETGNWLLGSNLRKQGSIHSDTWTGTAVDLAERQYIAVYPLNGWWKELKKTQRWNSQARYSLVISITTPETDIYTTIENELTSMIEV